MSKPVILTDPDICPTCAQRGRVINSRRKCGYRRRTRLCGLCGRKWNTYESLLNVQPVLARKRRALAAPSPSPAVVPPPTQAPSPAPPSPVVPSPMPASATGRRVVRSSYLTR